MMCQICRFSLRVNFPGSEFLFWRQSGFLGKFAVPNLPVALFPDGKFATGKLATNSQNRFINEYARKKKGKISESKSFLVKYKRTCVLKKYLALLSFLETLTHKQLICIISKSVQTTLI